MKAPPGLAHLLIGQPELTEGMMRALALKGTLPQYLDGDIQAGITLADLTDPEFLFLRRYTRVFQGVNLAATAAQFSQIAFAPTAGAGRTMCVVERLWLANGTGVAQNYFLDCFTSALIGAAAGIPKAAMDDRAMPFNVGQPVPNFGIVNATAAAAIAPTGIVIALQAGGFLDLRLDIICTARSVNTTPSPMLVMLQGSAVNQPLQAGFIWRERQLLSTEG